jgi:signal transduction histidine kinase
LSNLVSNALRHTPRGGRIRLIAEHNGADVRLRVADTGPGIAAADLPYIFQRFYRADPSRYPAEGQTGLGLAIAKSLVEAHGGTLGVESVKGEGSTFTITLSVEPGASAEARST